MKSLYKNISLIKFEIIYIAYWLRFNGFNNGWNEDYLNKLFDNRNERNFENLEVLSVTINDGVLKRSDLGSDRKNKDKKSMKHVLKGDLVYNPMFMWKGASGISSYEGITSADYIVLKSKKDVNSIFFSHLFQTEKSLNKFKNYSQGSLLERLRLMYPQFSDIKMAFPDYDEQEKIANFLTSIDNKIELLEKKYQSYLDFKKYLMQQIFAQKLRFAEFEDEWIPYKIGDISETYSGGTPSTSKKEYYKGNIPFIKSGEINNNVTEQYITEDALKNSSAKKVQKGDLLLALYGATSGEVAISKIDGAINQAVLKIDNNMDNYFQYCYFLMYKDQIVHKYIQGGQGNLSANIIKKLEFKYPSLAEQKKISQFFMSFDNKLELYENKIIKYNNLKKGLLQQMFVYIFMPTILNFCAKICCIKYFLKS